jgi:hypothetical protein
LNKTGQTVAMPDALGFYLVSVARRAVAGLIFLAMGLPYKSKRHESSL